MGLKATVLLQGDSLLFTAMSPEVPATHLIDFEGWKAESTLKNLGVLNQGPQDCESSALTTRDCSTFLSYLFCLLFLFCSLEKMWNVCRVFNVFFKRIEVYIYIARAVIPLSTFGKFTTGPSAPRYSIISIKILE